jgi:hypothetical protein
MKDSFEYGNDLQTAHMAGNFLTLHDCYFPQGGFSSMKLVKLI